MKTFHEKLVLYELHKQNWYWQTAISKLTSTPHSILQIADLTNQAGKSVNQKQRWLQNWMQKLLYLLLIFFSLKIEDA